MLFSQAHASTTYTAGNTTIGSVMYNGQNNVLSASQITTGEGTGLLNSISIYIGTVHAAPRDHMQVALYADTGTNSPGNQLVVSNPQVLNANAWNVFSMPSALIAANTNYWLVFNVDGSATQVPIILNQARSTWKYPIAYGTWPTSFGTPTRPIETKQYSIYMTYESMDTTPTPSPTITPTPTTTITPTPTPPTGGTPGCGLPVIPGATTRTIVVNGVQRTYLVVVPSGVNANTPTPIIMGFHGGNGHSQGARSLYGLEGVNSVIYVYPQAPYWPEAGGVGWNVDPAGVDFPYMDTLLTDLGNRHCVDRSRISAVGMSNGGFFVNALACHRPGVLRGISSVAGGGPESSCSQAVAAMIVHGSTDTVVSIAKGRYSRDYWLAANRYTGTPAVPTTPSPCVSYPGTLKPVFWCQHGGGHIWPSWAGAGVRNFFLSL